MNARGSLALVACTAALAVGLLGGSRLQAEKAPKAADTAPSGRQGWEYKVVLRGRSLAFTPVLGGNVADQYNWSGWAWSDAAGNALPGDMSALLAQLGADGWELVSVATVSSEIGTLASGDTNSLDFVFKRPKQ